MARTRKQFVDGQLVSETPYTLAEEIQADCQEELVQLTLDMIGGLPYPTTIEEWRTRYNPLNAVNTRLTRAGINPSDVPLLARKAVAGILDIYFRGVTFIHSKPPGMAV